MIRFGSGNIPVVSRGFNDEKAAVIEKTVGQVLDAVGIDPGEGLDEITLYNAQVSTHEGTVRAAINATKQLGLFNQFTAKSDVEKVPADLAHELAHVISPFSEYAQSLHKDSNAIPHSQAILQLLGFQCLLTETYLNKYHALTADQYFRGKISFDDFADETFSILIETLIFNPGQLSPTKRTLEERMKRLGPELSAADPLMAAVTILSRIRGTSGDLVEILRKSYKSGEDAKEIIGKLIHDLKVQNPDEW